jgi:hypothetical protein
MLSVLPRLSLCRETRPRESYCCVTGALLSGQTLRVISALLLPAVV